MRELKEIIIHCTATKPDFMRGATTTERRDEIRRWHVDGNGWADIGYHHLIDRDGTLIEGRPLNKTGAHVKGHNTGTIGVSLFGGHGSSENDAFADNFTPEQNKALRQYIRSMQGKYPSIKKISGHNEYAAKACPGFRVSSWLNNRPAERSSPVKSTTLQAAAASATSDAVVLFTAFSKIDSTTQVIIAVCGAVSLFSLIWISKERIRKWGKGDR